MIWTFLEAFTSSSIRSNSSALCFRNRSKRFSFSFSSLRDSFELKETGTIACKGWCLNAKIDLTNVATEWIHFVVAPSCSLLRWFSKISEATNVCLLSRIWLFWTSNRNEQIVCNFQQSKPLLSNQNIQKLNLSFFQCRWTNVY
jgi:hypothetical protein